MILRYNSSIVSSLFTTSTLAGRASPRNKISPVNSFPVAIDAAVSIEKTDLLTPPGATIAEINPFKILFCTIQSLGGMAATTGYSGSSPVENETACSLCSSSSLSLSREDRTFLAFWKIEANVRIRSLKLFLPKEDHFSFSSIRS